MRYLGGKYREAKKFSPILIRELQKKEGRFYEPFVGGFNLIPNLYFSVNSAVCSDTHYGLIVLYKSLQKGYIPPSIVTEDEYRKAKNNLDWDNPETAFIAFGCSFGGKEWGGYAKSVNNGIERNYANEAKNSLLMKMKYTFNVVFKNQRYTQEIPKNSVIYCDPPYKETTRYKVGVINYDEFYDWCELAAKNNNTVFVSEFNNPKPDKWDIVWEMDRKIAVSGMKKTKINKELLIKVNI